MAETKKTVNTTHKKKRKLNAKGRALVRRSIGGVLLASSLIVAAIPSDRSGKASAAIPDDMNLFDAVNMLNGVREDGTFYGRDDSERLGNTGLVYADDLKDAKEDYSKYDLDDYDTSTKYQSLFVNSNGQLQELFGYYMTNLEGHPSEVGVIGKLSDTVTVNDLTITNMVCKCYDYYTDAEYNNTMDDYIYYSYTVADPTADKAYKTDNDKTGAGAVTNYIEILTMDKLKLLFPQEVETMNVEYEEARKEYYAIHQVYPSYQDLVDLGMFDEFHYFSGAKIKEDNAFRFFCNEKKSRINGTPLTNDYTLKRVSTVLVSNLVNPDPSKPSYSNKDVQNIYIVKYEPSDGKEKDLNIMDTDGLLYASADNIIAVGANAMKGNDSIRTLTIEEGVKYVGKDAFNNCTSLRNVTLKGISFIDSRVFYGCSNLSGVSMEGDIQTIGNEAFYNCAVLPSIEIPDQVNNIGFGAFAKCSKLSSVVLRSNKDCILGDYAFYDDPVLSNVDFSQMNLGVSLGKGCFALADKSNADTMTAFTFPPVLSRDSRRSFTVYGANLDLFTDGTEAKGAGTGAVVPNTVTLDTAGVSALKTPCEYQTCVGDFLFANRSKLSTIKLDALGTKKERLPMNTFLGCDMLKEVRLADDEDLLEFDANIFRDVKQTDLCVYGPSNSTTNTGESEKDYGYYAQPRMSTWATYTGASGKTGYVPYRYSRGGFDHFEVGGNTSGKSFIFDLSLNSDGQTASLQNCTFLGNLGSTELGTEEEPFTIPSQVAEYSVTSLMPGSLDRVKNNILYLEVPDNSLETLDSNTFENSKILKGVFLGDSVKTIGDACFKGCPKLEKVKIGVGIMNIGENAFSNCPELEDVYWDEPAYLVNFNIGQNAFATTSDKLYFHGSTDSATYAPFDYAMQDSNTINGNTHICYMSSLPFDVDDANNTPHMTDAERKSRIQTMSIISYNGEPLLINYPRFQNLPGSIRDALSNGQYGNLNQTEQYMVGSSMSVSVPPVVKSIDVNSFINSAKVGSDKKYLEADEQAMYGGASVASNYTSKALLSSLADDTDHPGLFSGRTVDTNDQMVKAIRAMGETGFDKNYTVKSTRGNDWVTSIQIPCVESIPDYCFESCERLNTLNLGSSLGKTSQSVGKFAFHDCENLQFLYADYGGAGPSEYLTCENMILYRKENGVPAELMACLSARGLDAEYISNPAKVNSVISDSVDTAIANLTSIRSDAFDGCVNIKGIDLTQASGLRKIESDTFNGCSSLADIKFPSDLQDIGDGALKGCDKNLRVRIPGNTSINVNAFDDYDPNYYIRVQTPDKINGFLTAAYKCTTESGYGPAHIHWDPMYMVRIEFYDDENCTNKLKEDIYKSIENGSVDLEKSELPDSTQIPYFVDWGWKMDNGEIVQGTLAITRIQEDRKIFAITNPPVPTEPEYYNIIFYDDIGGPIPGAIEQVQAGYTNFVPKDWKMGLQTQVSGRNPAEWEFDCWICYAGGVRQADDAIYHATINSNWSCNASFKMKSSASNNTPSTAPVSPTDAPSPTPKQPTPTPNNTTPTAVPSGSNTTGTPTPTGSNSQNVTGKMYYAIVENGSGSGQYPAGSVITVTAYAAPEGRTFDRWTTSNTDIGISNILATSTTFIMPTHDVKVTATYKSSVSGNNPTGAYPTKQTVPTGGMPTATPTPVGYNGGTEVRITTDTIDNNKKNLGSASVAGSTDNFIVKITDSAAATAAVESALRSAYGERFTDLRYAAFDISLYDSTGTYLVANANNLAVTITVPIPEALLSYAGNNKAGAVINGQLQELAVNFTTIDGVPCMRFTATHFSPYTIYVDTKNIVRGITDNTPKTGDGIAPKWFLSGGMLSMSAVLFLWKEKNPILAEDKKRKKRSSGR